MMLELAKDDACRVCGASFPKEEVDRDFHGMCPACLMGFTMEGGGEVPETISPAESLLVGEDGMELPFGPGTSFGGFEILGMVGLGGTGVVYRARQINLNRVVALKVLSAPLAARSDFIERFKREAQTAARLRHSNMVPVHEMGIIEGKHYISMDLMEGGSLSEMIHVGGGGDGTRFHQDPDRFLGILRDIAHAVDHAHRQEPPIVHRDLKPHNVLLDGDGKPYVADFGLAKEIDLSRNQTVTGEIKGTPSYMSPEQAAGKNKEIDARTDVYALGAILYEMLTGVPPFRGNNVRDVLNEIVTLDPERPNARIARKSNDGDPGQTPLKAVPRPLETICLKALEKEKHCRYESARALAEDISRYLAGEGIHATEPGLWRRLCGAVRARPRMAGAIGALLLALAAASFAVGFWPRRASEGVVDAVVTRADRSLSKQQWAVLASDIAELKERDPEHPRIPEFEKALRAHQVLETASRLDWDDALKALHTTPFPKALLQLETQYGEATTLRGEFQAAAQHAFLKLQAHVLRKGQVLAQADPNNAWLRQDTKAEAARLKDIAEGLVGLASHTQFPFRADPELARLTKGLSRVIQFRGVVTLRVDVVPFAEVVIRQGGKERMREFTPFALTGLEISTGAIVLEFYWPSQQAPRVRLTQKVNRLKHGTTILVGGDIRSSRIEVTVQ